MTSEVNSRDVKECQKSSLNQRGARLLKGRMVFYGFRTMHPWVKNFGAASQRNLWQSKNMPAQSVAELIGNAVKLKQITKAQASALLRHRKHFTEGHLVHMFHLMATKHFSFKEAHERTMKAVGK